MTDKFKFAFSLLALLAGLVGFYLMAEQALVLRIISVLVGMVVAVAIGLKTARGQQLRLFADEAVVEVRKVVWPSRKETVQTTAAVFAFVLVMAVILYLTDKTLEWVMYDIILGWRK